MPVTQGKVSTQAQRKSVGGWEELHAKPEHERAYYSFLDL